MGLKTVVGPAVELLTLDEVKASLVYVDHDQDNDKIEIAIKAAREQAENFTRQRFISQTVDFCLERFPSGNRFLEIPCRPLQAVESVTYLDPDGVRQTFTDYDVFILHEPPGIRPIYGTCWPAHRVREESIYIRLSCGFGPTPESVPASIKEAVHLMIPFYYEGRDPSQSDWSAFNALLAPHVWSYL